MKQGVGGSPEMSMVERVRMGVSPFGSSDDMYGIGTDI